MSDSDDPLRADDPVIENPPDWLPGPVYRWLADLTYREWHAALLGLLGVFVGAAWTAGFRPEAVGVTVATVGIAFGLRALPDNAPVAGRVIRREPWYFTVPFVATAVLAAFIATSV